MKPRLVIFGIGTVVIALVVFLNNRNVPDQHVFAQNASASRDDVATPTPNQTITQRPVEEPTISPSLLDLSSVTIVHRFTSPEWLRSLKEYLAAAASDLINQKL